MISLDQYLRRLSGLEKDPSETICDHSYVKHWSAHAGSERTKPARMLFMNTFSRSESAYVNPDEEIDVLGDSDKPAIPSPFDSQRTKILINELEHSLKCNLNRDMESSELEDFPIENYSPQRRKMYREVMEIINADILARTAYSGQTNEFILRKIVTEKCARELRIVFANTFYDFDIILWIHQLILDKGNLSTVLSYLYILQSLKAKVPTLVDRILKSYSGQLGYGYLNQILKKHWDPCVPVLNQHKPKKLPGSPLLIMCSAGFNLTKALNESLRFISWSNHLSLLCKTVYVPMNFNEHSNGTFGEAIDETLLNLRGKITEFKNHYPNRPVILCGWTIGALISCLVALEADVDAVICFGFPLTGVNGSRGGLEDPLLDCKVPTLFIVGQNSNMCSIDDIEDFRSRLKAISGLVVIGGADDVLRVSPQKMMSDSITQEIVDRCILDEISNFLESCFGKPQATTSAPASNTVKICPPARAESPDIINPDEVGKRKRRRPREYSPELISSRKKSHSFTKENPSTSFKSHVPSSSSRPGRRGRHHLSKAAKSSPDKRSVGRPPSGSNKKKVPPVIIPASAVLKGGVPLKSFKPESPIVPIIPPEEPAPKPAKPAVPFALNILPKKNVPVDVDAAFGSDSSFLPRPLTPPELSLEDNTVSAEETESAVSQLDASSALVSSVAAELPSTSFTTSTPQIISLTEKAVVPPPQQTTHIPQVTKTTSSPIIKHVLTAKPETSKLVAVTTTSSGIKTVFLKEKGLSSTAMSQLKADGTFVARAINPNQVKSPNATKTMITVPLSAAPLLVSGQTLKTPSGKIFQFLSKSPSQSKEAISPKVIGSAHMSDGTHQICNISPFQNMPKKIETTTSSSATLVKLAVPEKSPAVKHIQVVRPSLSRSDLSKTETAAEMIEKQLAIQALNESVSMELSDEPLTSYAKPSTSIISRVVPRPGHPPYIRQSIIAHPPMRGRMRPILPNKMYQMYPK